MQICDSLIYAGTVITQNENRDILENAYIAINDGQFIEIGQAETLKNKWQAKNILDYSKMLVMPGLINGHTHAAMTFLRGLADDLPLMEWLEKSIFPIEARLTRDIVYWGSLLGYAEMLASGTTACIDMYIYEEAVFDAALTAGLRCMGGEATFAFPSAACANWQKAIEITEQLAEKFQNHGRLKVAVNPHSIYTTNAEILANCRDLALKYNLPLHIHLAETERETLRSQELYNMRPIEWCEHNGLTDCKMICAHMVDITEDEAARLGKFNVCAIHNPVSNMKLASGIAPVEMAQAAGLTFALGTDGPASNNNVNMFNEMRMAALAQKIASKSPIALPASKIFDMATLNGAVAFGEPALGKIAPGSPADCIALKIDSPHMQPLYNPVSQMVYAANGQECVMTMVGGDVLYADGKFTGFDYSDLLKEVKNLKKFAQKKTID